MSNIYFLLILNAAFIRNIYFTFNFDMKELIDKFADCLNYFISDYFKLELADDSDIAFSKDLIKLYDDLK